MWSQWKMLSQQKVLCLYTPSLFVSMVTWRTQAASFSCFPAGDGHKWLNPLSCSAWCLKAEESVFCGSSHRWDWTAPCNFVWHVDLLGGEPVSAMRTKHPCTYFNFVSIVRSCRLLWFPNHKKCSSLQSFDSSKHETETMEKKRSPPFPFFGNRKIQTPMLLSFLLLPLAWGCNQVSRW